MALLVFAFATCSLLFEASCHLQGAVRKQRTIRYQRKFEKARHQQGCHNKTYLFQT
jgi:hypothetical protein